MKPCKQCQVPIDDALYCPRCSARQDGRDYVFGLTFRGVVVLCLVVAALILALGGVIGYYLGGTGGAVAGGMVGLVIDLGLLVWLSDLQGG